MGDPSVLLGRLDQTPVQPGTALPPPIVKKLSIRKEEGGKNLLRTDRSIDRPTDRAGRAEVRCIPGLANSFQISELSGRIPRSGLDTDERSIKSLRVQHELRILPSIF